jgi:hypothetical protein
VVGGCPLDNIAARRGGDINWQELRLTRAFGRGSSFRRASVIKAFFNKKKNIKGSLNGFTRNGKQH